jgi:hypothetical protein
MIVSLLYKVTWKLLSVLLALLCSEAAKHAVRFWDTDVEATAWRICEFAGTPITAEERSAQFRDHVYQAPATEGSLGRTVVGTRTADGGVMTVRPQGALAPRLDYEQ